MPHKKLRGQFLYADELKKTIREMKSQPKRTVGVEDINRLYKGPGHRQPERIWAKIAT